MTKTINSNNKLLKDPKNYVAVYARTSSTVENNSIAAQISEGKRVINNKNLLLYAVYVDQVSGFNTSPPDRVGFGKLLEDAKSGCFSTLVAYRHDRIARNLNDWVNLKNQLRKLKIEIIFSDDNEYASDNSVQGEFLENLIVMVGELEPNTIKERTSAGRLQRRTEGAYSSGGHCPFGYNKIANDKLTSKGKSYYEVDPLAAIFVQRIFCEAKDVLGKKKFTIEDIKRSLQDYIDNLPTSTVDSLSEVLIPYAHDTQERLINSHEKEDIFKNFNEILNNHFKKTNLLEIKKDLIRIKAHIIKPGNINSLLRNSTYGGYMLKNTKENEEEGEEEEGKKEKEESIIIEDKIPRLNKAAFIKLNNVDSIVDEDTFAKVYSYIRMPDVLKEKEPNYLFKGKLKCGNSNCKTILRFTNGLLQCNCKSYAKNSVIEALLDIIIDDAFGNSKNGFNNFRTTIEGKLDALRLALQKLRNIKICQLQNYLEEKNKRCIRDVQENQKEINTLLQKIATYANELSYINRLQQVIECYNNSSFKNEKSDSDILKIKTSIIAYIESNQDIFNPIFNKLIKEIKVSTFERKNNIKCRFKINYEFEYKKPKDKKSKGKKSKDKKHSDISTSIH
ncbi:MAG TPA: recombinase family protein [Clostridium sp.]|uniref:recombinase family protein n=1 Tax=Clostridium sp. TaxID=1506 RepID=UPI002F946F73